MTSATRTPSRDRSRRGELQRLLGELGEVMPRLPRGTPTLPAQGWYARMSDGKVRFLGDTTTVAAYSIAHLLETTSTNGNGKRRRRA